MLKIAIVSKFSPYRGYGVEEVVRQNIECNSNNFRSIIVVFYYTYEKEKIQIKKIGKSTVILRPIRVPKITLLDRLIYNLFIGFLLCKKYNLLHTHAETGFGYFIIRKITKDKTPWIHTFHGVWTLLLTFRTRYTKNLVKKFILKITRNIAKFLEKHLIKEINIGIVVSYKTNIELSILFNSKEKLIVIPNSFNEKLFKKYDKNLSLKILDLSKNYKYLLYIGRDLQIKGFDIVLKIMEKLIEKRTDIKLIALVGHQNINLPEKLRDYVILFKRLESEKMPYLYSVSEIFLFTSRRESFGIVGLEAMACETPVIFSNNIGLVKMLDRRKIPILPLNNIDLWVETIQKILNDKQYKIKIIEYEKSVVKNFTQKNICKQLIELYKKYLF